MRMKSLKTKLTDPKFISKASLVISIVSLAVAILVILLKSR